MTYSSKIISGGKVALPAAIRKALAMKDGDRILIDEQDGKIVIQTASRALSSLQDDMRRLVPPHVNVVDDFLTSRAREEQDAEARLAKDR